MFLHQSVNRCFPVSLSVWANPKFILRNICNQNVFLYAVSGTWKCMDQGGQIAHITKDQRCKNQSYSNANVWRANSTNYSSRATMRKINLAPIQTLCVFWIFRIFRIFRMFRIFRIFSSQSAHFDYCKLIYV